MSATDFFDTDIALYLLSSDAAKADRAEALLAKGGTISVQVLNEFVAVARRKYDVPWAVVEGTLAALRHVCRIEPLGIEVHESAVALCKRHRMPIYDACIVAAAMQAGCTTLYSEDFQRNRKFGSLQVVNPFSA